MTGSGNKDAGRGGAPALNGHVPSAGALRVLAALEAAGAEAWIVGGWVRDALMDLPDHDIDLTCSAPWQESKRALEAAGLAVVESGVKFGGITAVVYPDGPAGEKDGAGTAAPERIEVTTYRIDGFYTDGRHPDAVTFARTVEEDLARRDFTVNAMAWHPRRGLLDLYGGADDIRTRLIRAVGNPRTRFEEDALRMLRAVRFACRLGFAVEEGTARALAACAPLLDQVARERVGWELDRILLTGRGGEAMARYPEVLCAAVPELAAMRGFEQRTPYHCYDVYGHVARVLAWAGGHPLAGGEAADEARAAEARWPRGASVAGGAGSTSAIPAASAAAPSGSAAGGAADAANAATQSALEPAPSRSLIWAALLHDVGKPATFTEDKNGQGHFYGHPEAGERMARAVMRRLGLPAALIREVCLLVRYHDTPLAPERSALLGMAARLAGEGLDTPRLMDELFDLRRADALGKAPRCFAYLEDIERMRALMRELVAEGAPYRTKMLALTGSDLIAAGIASGPELGRRINELLAAVMRGEVANERDALLAYALGGNGGAEPRG